MGVDAGELRMTGIVWDTRMKVDTKDKTSDNGVVMRVKKDDPDAMTKIREAAKEHKGAEILTEVNGEYVLYASDEDPNAKDLCQIGNTRAGAYVNVNGTKLHTSAGFEPVQAIFTNDDREITLQSNELSQGIQVLKDRTLNTEDERVSAANAPKDWRFGGKI